MGSWTGAEPENRHKLSESVKIQFFKVV